MGIISSFVRFVGSIVLFVVVLILGIVFAPQIASAFSNHIPGGTVTVGSVHIPVLASIVASLALTLVVNLLALPFRRRE